MEVVTNLFFPCCESEKIIKKKKLWGTWFVLTVFDWMEVDLNANYHILIKNYKVKKGEFPNLKTGLITDKMVPYIKIQFYFV